MRRSALLVLMLLAPVSAWAQDACDRPCLEQMLERYVDALVARDPSKLSTTTSVVFTENGQRLALGDGLWHTVTGRGGYALRLADVERGQAVLMGTIREADVPTILVVRLKVERRRIAEAETLVIRNEAAAKSLDTIGTPRAAWSQPVPAAERSTRGDLVRIANMYFSGIERNDGKGQYPIADACARLENGVWTAGGPARTGCRQQFESGVFFYVTRIRDRRFVLVDPERGLAFAFAFFDNGSGDAATARWRTAGKWCRARRFHGPGRLPRCSRSSAASSAPWSPCSIRFPTGWDPDGARGSRRCPARHERSGRSGRSGESGR